MTTTIHAPELPLQPGTVVVRESVSAVDLSDSEDLLDGVDAAGLHYAALDVVLEGGPISASIEILFWSEVARKFVLNSPAIEFNGLTATCQIPVEVHGRRFWPKVTALAGDEQATGTLTVVAASAIRAGGLDQIELMPGKILYWDKDSSRTQSANEKEVTVDGADNQATVRTKTINDINAAGWGVTAAPHADAGKITLTVNVAGAAGNHTLVDSDLDDAGWAVTGLSGGADATTIVSISASGLESR